MFSYLLFISRYMMIEKAVLFNLKVSVACSWLLPSNNAQCYLWLELPKSLRKIR